MNQESSASWIESKDQWGRLL